MDNKLKLLTGLSIVLGAASVSANVSAETSKTYASTVQASSFSVEQTKSGPDRKNRHCQRECDEPQPKRTAYYDIDEEFLSMMEEHYRLKNQKTED